MTFHAFQADRAVALPQLSRLASFHWDSAAILPGQSEFPRIFAGLRGFGPPTLEPIRLIRSDIALVHVAVTRGPELAPTDLRGVRIGIPRAYYWEALDGELAKIMKASLDKLRNAGAVFVDVDFTDLTKAELAVRAVLPLEGFRVDLA
jgi:hypothetical protein